MSSENRPKGSNDLIQMIAEITGLPKHEVYEMFGPSRPTQGQANQENAKLLELIRSFDRRLQAIEKMLQSGSGQQTIYRSEKVPVGTSLGGEEYVKGVSGERQHIERIPFCKCGEEIEGPKLKCTSCGHLLHRRCSVWEAARAFCVDCKKPPLSWTDFKILLSRSMGLYLYDIEEATGMRGPALGSRLKKFEENGWVVITESKKRGTITGVRLTEQGFELLERAKEYYSTVDAVREFEELARELKLRTTWKIFNPPETWAREDPNRFGGSRVELPYWMKPKGIE